LYALLVPSSVLFFVTHSLTSLHTFLSFI
jgi:hypothetical protein